MTEPEQSEIADLLAPFWSTQRTANALGLSEDEPEERRAAGTLRGLTPTGGPTHYPVWQLHRLKDGTVEVKPAVIAFIANLQGISDAWTREIILRTPAPELDGSTAEEWIRAKGDLATLANCARRIASEFRR